MPPFSQHWQSLSKSVGVLLCFGVLFTMGCPADMLGSVGNLPRGRNASTTIDAVRNTDVLESWGGFSSGVMRFDSIPDVVFDRQTYAIGIPSLVKIFSPTYYGIHLFEVDLRVRVDTLRGSVYALSPFNAVRDAQCIQLRGQIGPVLVITASNRSATFMSAMFSLRDHKRSIPIHQSSEPVVLQVSGDGREDGAGRCPRFGQIAVSFEMRVQDVVGGIGYPRVLPCRVVPTAIVTIPFPSFQECRPNRVGGRFNQWDENGVVGLVKIAVSPDKPKQVGPLRGHVFHEEARVNLLGFGSFAASFSNKTKACFWGNEQAQFSRVSINRFGATAKVFGRSLATYQGVVLNEPVKLGGSEGKVHEVVVPSYIHS